jgi:hypothetical protein
MNDSTDGHGQGRSQNGLFARGLSVYKTVSPEEYRAVLRNGLVVLDTNSLLDLYRYHEETRKNFLRLYESIGDNLWIPQHVMFEFLERRVDVLDERRGYPDAVVEELQGLISTYKERVLTWANRVNLPSGGKDEIVGVIENASREVGERIRNLSRDDSLNGAEDTPKDPVLAALEPIILGCIGDPLPPDELKEARAEARKRIVDRRPPGYMDANKKGENADGDYLIWYETLREAARRQVDVLLVTRDQKQDWWRIEKGQAKGPRWELADELESRAGTRLYMLRPASLGQHAPQPLPEKSLEDAKRVSNKAYIGWRPQPGWGTVRRYVEVPGGNGKIDIAFHFVFDDGSGTRPTVLSDTYPRAELGEYARGIFLGDEVLIKIGADGMAQAEDTFERINRLEPGERALMFMDSSDLHEQCGYAWTPEYKLVKAAPGLSSVF